MKINKQKQGKSNRRKGGAFELSVRKDLELKGWIVAKWTNNVDFEEFPDESGIPFKGEGKLISAKRKFNPFNKALTLGTGFPDFISFRRKVITTSEIQEIQILKEKIDEMQVYEVIGIEAKSNGYLDKEEKEKCRWLLDNYVFSRILIASKPKKRGKIEYKEFK